MLKLVKTLAQYVVLIPLAHLIACSVFLMGYVTTFGDNVSTLFALSDLFTISFGGIAALYVTTIAFPAMVMFFRHASNKEFVDSFPQKSIEELEEIREKYAKRIRIFERGFLVSFIASTLVISYESYFNHPCPFRYG